ncbi:MBL fold metallo-hydrolase [bacterium]|nr:MBL fold metallo-hydrolase [bacterium]
MIKLQVIGSRANWSKPFKNKKIKKFTSCFLETDKKFQIDAGNPWDKKKINYLLITHLHQDHIGKIQTYPKETIFCLPSKTFAKKMPKGARTLLLKPNSKIGNTNIQPFLVHHSIHTLTYGFKISYQKTSFIWLPDYFSPFNFSVFKKTDYFFLGASSLKRDILHPGYLHGQISILHFLRKLKKRKISPKKRKIYLIHLGLSMFPLKEKISWLQRQFPEYHIITTYDGIKINL